MLISLLVVPYVVIFYFFFILSKEFFCRLAISILESSASLF